MGSTRQRENNPKNAATMPLTPYNNPMGVALSLDGTFALVADTLNHSIRKVVLTTGQVSIVAGTTGNAGSTDGVGAAARFNAPSGVALASDGSFALVADTGNSVIRQITLSTGTVSTLAGSAGQIGSTDAIGAAARFSAPFDVALSSDRTVALVTDLPNNTIRQIVLATAAVSTLAGSAGTAGSADGVGATARFNAPAGITLSADGSTALVADALNHTIRSIAVATGTVSTLAGSAGNFGSVDGVGTAARFLTPYGVALAANGGLALVADTGNSTIRRLTVASATVSTLAGKDLASGNSDGPGTVALFAAPYGLALDVAGHYAIVADTLNNSLRKLVIATGTVFTVMNAAVNFLPFVRH